MSMLYNAFVLVHLSSVYCTVLLFLMSINNCVLYVRTSTIFSLTALWIIFCAAL